MLILDVPSESKARAKYFGDKAHRQAVGLKGKEVAMEFCNGLLGTFLPSPLSDLPSVNLVSLSATCQLSIERIVVCIVEQVN